MMDKPNIFFSYSRKDGEIMRRILADLEAAGLAVWTDQGLEPGTPMWTSAIERAIDASVCLVALLSPSAKKSDWVKRELITAREKGVMIVPLLVRGEPIDAVPFAFRGIQLVDIRRDYSARIQGVVELLTGKVDERLREIEAEAEEQARNLEQEPEFQAYVDSILDGTWEGYENSPPQRRKTGLSENDIAAFLQNKQGSFVVIGQTWLFFTKTAYIMVGVSLSEHQAADDGLREALRGRGWKYSPPSSGGDGSQSEGFSRTWPMWEDHEYLLEIAREILAANRILGFAAEELELPLD